MCHMARVALREIGVEPFGSKVRRARLALGLTYDQAYERVNAVYPASRRSIARLEESVDVPTGTRQVLAYIVLLAYGIEPGSAGLAGSTADRLVNREEVLRALPPLSAPRRTSSGQSPFAGSGSSPRRFGCSEDVFARLQLTWPPTRALAA